ncbi:MAG: hypothetical protein AB7Q69_06845 [Gemmatimonadales bacterium]
MSHVLLGIPQAGAGRRASLLRRAPRALALGSVLALSMCTVADRSGPDTGPAMGLRPVFPPQFSLFASTLAVEQVRIQIARHPGGDILATRTVPFSPDSTELTVPLSIPLTSSQDSLRATLQYMTGTGAVLFTGSVLLEIVAGAPATPLSDVSVTYSGPGSNVASMFITPADSSVVSGDSIAFTVTAIDSSQQPVPSLYVSWGTSDPTVSINAFGLLRAPNLSKSINVFAFTPNGVTASTPLLLIGSGLGILPDSVEKLPNGRQQFSVAAGGAPGPYIWSVNGVDGGNATFGTIDPQGLYVAPATVPNPAIFLVCARASANPSASGCATVVISPVPSAGADVIVFNDINMFQDQAVVLPGNARLVENLVNFSITGVRSGAKTVIFDYSHDSKCFQTSECGGSVLQLMHGVIAQLGLTVDSFTVGTTITSVAPAVKAIFIWTPEVPYDTTEINALKAFAAEGGRIVFLGERLPYYLSYGIDSVENRFFQEMGAQLTNIGADVAFAPNYTVPIPQTGRHQVMTGVDSVAFSAASIVLPGPNDFVLVRDTTATQDVLGAVAKIDVTPLPVPPRPTRKPAAARGAVSNERAGARVED